MITGLAKNRMENAARVSGLPANLMDWFNTSG
jgi:hypothetical protein